MCHYLLITHLWIIPVPGGPTTSLSVNQSRQPSSTRVPSEWLGPSQLGCRVVGRAHKPQGKHGESVFLELILYNDFR